jgi:Flp pilus assembly protein TadD
MTFPLVMLLLDWYPLGRIPAHVKEWIRSPNFRRACWEKIPFVAIALVSMALAIYGQRLNAAMGSVEGHTLPARIVQSFYGLMWYVWKSLWPSSLSPLYPLHVPLDVLSPQFVLNIFAVCGVAATLWRLRMRFPAPWIAWCAYAVMVSPMLGLVQSGPQITADRYSYLACLPWALLAAGWVWTLVRPVSRDAVSDTGIVDASPPKIPGRFPQLVWGIAAVATLLLARQTFAQLRIWHDDRTLWAEALRIEERNVTAHLNLGIALLDAEDTTGSLRHINRAVELQPGHPDTYVNRALVFSRMERYRDAAADLRNACRLKPSWVRPRLDLTVALTNMCDDAAAAAELQELSRLDPGHAQEYREGIEMLRKLRDQRRQALPVP